MRKDLVSPLVNRIVFIRLKTMIWIFLLSLFKLFDKQEEQEEKKIIYDGQYIIYTYIQREQNKTNKEERTTKVFVG